MLGRAREGKGCKVSEEISVISVVKSCRTDKARLFDPWVVEMSSVRFWVGQEGGVGWGWGRGGGYTGDAEAVVRR